MENKETVSFQTSPSSPLPSCHFVQIAEHMTSSIDSVIAINRASVKSFKWLSVYVTPPLSSMTSQAIKIRATGPNATFSSDTLI